MIFPLLIFGAVLASLTERERADAPAAGVAGGACALRRDGACSCSPGGAAVGTLGPAALDPAGAFGAYLVDRTMAGDAGAHELVAFLEHAASSNRNAHAARVVAAMHHAFMLRHGASTSELVAHMRLLGSVGLA